MLKETKRASRAVELKIINPPSIIFFIFEDIEISEEFNINILEDFDRKENSNCFPLNALLN